MIVLVALCTLGVSITTLCLVGFVIEQGMGWRRSGVSVDEQQRRDMLG